MVALGKCGSREMSAGSDLDLMTLYRAADPARGLGGQGLGRGDLLRPLHPAADRGALGARPAQGGLYEVDMQLRPSGTKGPVAVSFAAFEGYYDGEAETWELLALTRARVVWSTSAGLRRGGAEAPSRRRCAGRATAAAAAADVREMRELMAPRAAAQGRLGPEADAAAAWSTSSSPPSTCSSPTPATAARWRPTPPRRSRRFGEAGLAPAEPLADLERAWRLQQDLSQLLKVALADGADPSHEPEPLRALLAKAGHAADFKALTETLREQKAAARRAFEAVLG